MTPESLFQKKKILICAGSGGVGKTTTSAAIALHAASLGKKTIVLTIDPAKRLATAMGLTSLGNEPREVALGNVPGKLYAMMLDTKRTFDRLIERYTSNPEKRKAIFENHLYRQMSNMIAGSQEYMAMERLYEIHEEGQYDLIVLDTPPTRHALDFLEAPKKMVNLTQNSLLKWFLKPALFAGGMPGNLSAWGPLQKIADKILNVFDRLAGFHFLHELAEMIALLGGLLGGFHDRAEAVYEMMRQKHVGFLLIASPASVSIQDALYFHKKIAESGLPFAGFVVNRVHVPLPQSALTARSLESVSATAREKIARVLQDYSQLATHDQKAMTLLKKMGGKGALQMSVPLFTSDIHDVEGLRQINKYLFPSQ